MKLTWCNKKVSERAAVFTNYNTEIETRSKIFQSTAFDF